MLIFKNFFLFSIVHKDAGYLMTWTRWHVSCQIGSLYCTHPYLIETMQDRSFRSLSEMKVQMNKSIKFWLSTFLCSVNRSLHGREVPRHQSQSHRDQPRSFQTTSASASCSVLALPCKVWACSVVLCPHCSRLPQPLLLLPLSRQLC